MGLTPKRVSQRSLAWSITGVLVSGWEDQLKALPFSPLLERFSRASGWSRVVWNTMLSQSPVSPLFGAPRTRFLKLVKTNGTYAILCVSFNLDYLPYLL